MGEGNGGRGFPLRPWMLPAAALALVVLAWIGLHARRMVLEHRLEDLRAEKERLLRDREGTGGLEIDFGVRCPPVLELDPAWAHRMPWESNGESAVALLEGGGAEVRLMTPRGEPSNPLAWNPRFRVYDARLADLEPRRLRGFHVGVRLADGTWARTVPSNWPLPLCDPWVDCARGGCREGCLPDPLPPGVPLPPASVPPRCVAP